MNIIFAPGTILSAYPQDGTLAKRTPALKHFFPCNEISGNVLHDIIGGVSVDFAPTGKSLVFDSTDKSIGYSGFYTDNPIPISGAWAQCTAGKSALIMYSAKRDISQGSTNKPRIAIGDLNGLAGTNLAGIGLADGLFWHAVYGDVNSSYLDVSVSPSASIDDAITAKYGSVTAAKYLGYLKYTPTTVNTYQARTLDDNSMLVSANTVGVISPQTSNVATFTPAPYFRFGGLRLYGYAIYIFSSGLPSDIEAGVNWNAANWANGLRDSYPGWVGLT